ncbi:MAG: acetoacetate--CoA ligase [Acidimicrobiales bacterium]|nr:acetoacetate--CoA ligase [Acidimicrobiales bacterium]
MAEPLWTPSPDRAAGTNWHRFAAALGVDAAELHEMSLVEPERFWSAIWDDAGVIGHRGERVIERGDVFRHTRFFPDAALNVAENLLYAAGRADDEPAVLERSEDGSGRDITWGELRGLVARVQQALAAAGVQAGDRVAAWMPNVVETYALMLGAASLGAVFSSTSPDFGTDGVLDRFGQIEPTVLVAADGYRYGGKEHDCLERLAILLDRLPSVRSAVVVSHLGGRGGSLPEGAVGWDDWLAPYEGGRPTFEPLAFDHPWYVLYSSGTTGVPKCIVHRTGGVLLQHLKEHRLHCDVHPGDRVFYFTTAGWMMWNWLASALASGATIVVYDGSPAHPRLDRLFDLCDAEGISLFGTSAKFLESCAKGGASPRDTHQLADLRTICSTGSPLVAEGFEYVYEHIAADVHLASISGGTDLCGCLVGGDPTAPVWAGEIQGPALGLDIDVFDEDGFTASPGQRGELVCLTPFPSMPLGFWNDPGDEKYQRAYFERFDGVWHHGDFAECTEHGGYVIHGRSDSTLNPGGVRIGTAEIYRQVDAIDDVLESIVIGQQWGDDTRVVLFVRLRDGATLDDELRQRIRQQVRTGATPRHVPQVIVEVPDIPRTRSGKLVELAVRDVVHGRDVLNIEALANPEALAHFQDRPELQESS